jgi:hypothetical protein
MKRICFYIIVLMAGGLFACKKAYEPAVIRASNNFLVVEGVINTAPNGVTKINLSRTVNINDTVTFDPEAGALVTVEGDGGFFHLLHSSVEGEYVSDPLSLPLNQKYRLRIESGGSTYESDYITPRNNPEIDSISWERNEDVFTYVYTHDPANATRYYRWEYEETYQYNAVFNSVWRLNGNRIEAVDSLTQTYTCWMQNYSSDIILASTVALSQDVVNKLPMTRIRKNSEALFERYSVLVRQYALTEEENQFWEILKKNTQQLGTLFDPQPSQLKSNLRCVDNPAEPVIGYIGVCQVREKRLFIGHGQVPGWPAQIVNPTCEVQFVERNPVDNFLWIYSPPFAPYYFVTGGGMAIAPASCLDCTLRGGTNQKPAFW